MTNPWRIKASAENKSRWSHTQSFIMLLMCARRTAESKCFQAFSCVFSPDIKMILCDFGQERGKKKVIQGYNDADALCVSVCLFLMGMFA